ncbi:MAG: hypothetical protein GF355_02040, partial [Candidatus Eisenbacteria bacterium]|nr:hypothetical protein [Candidatus Eisenbacteria bacterium]
MRRSSLSPRGRRMGPWAGLFALLFLAGSAAAVPFHPDVVTQLRDEGRLEGMVSAMDDARTRDLNRPPATARGWLSGGDGLTTTERQAIVILVDFDDNEANQDDYPPQHYDDMLFSEGIYPTGSMRDWYLENSYGEFGVDG